MRVEREVIKTRETTPRTVRATISIGIAAATAGDSYDLDELIETADANLYKAKAAGRNCIIAPEEKPTQVVIGRMKT